MTTKVGWDFSRMAVLEHVITATGTFTGTAERGRATASLGSSNAKTRVASTKLGDHINGRRYVVRTAGGSSTGVVVDLEGWQVMPATGASANDVIAAINAFNEMEGVRYGRVQASIRADASDGTGASAVGVGSTTFSGGIAPTQITKEWNRFSSDADAGLFVFDHDVPLVLMQMGMRLSGSTAWTLNLRPLTAARGDLNTPYPVASGTNQNYLLLDTPAVIPPGWGLGFTASAQGSVWIAVREAR